jgi:hypothetical protein
MDDGDDETTVYIEDDDKPVAQSRELEYPRSGPIVLLALIAFLILLVALFSHNWVEGYTEEDIDIVIVEDTYRFGLWNVEVTSTFREGEGPWDPRTRTDHYVLKSHDLYVSATIVLVTFLIGVVFAGLFLLFVYLARAGHLRTDSRGHMQALPMTGTIAIILILISIFVFLTLFLNQVTNVLWDDFNWQRADMGGTIYWVIGGMIMLFLAVIMTMMSSKDAIANAELLRKRAAISTRERVR